MKSINIQYSRNGCKKFLSKLNYKPINGYWTFNVFVLVSGLPDYHTIQKVKIAIRKYFEKHKCCYEFSEPKINKLLNM